MKVEHYQASMRTRIVEAMMATYHYIGPDFYAQAKHGAPVEGMNLLDALHDFIRWYQDDKEAAEWFCALPTIACMRLMRDSGLMSTEEFDRERSKYESDD